MFTQHSKTENKHHGQELIAVTFIFNLIALKTLEQSMLLVHDILRYKKAYFFLPTLRVMHAIYLFFELVRKFCE